MKKVLLLGGTGYVGNAFSKELSKFGYENTKIGTKTNPNFIIGNEINRDLITEHDVIIYLSWYFDTTDKNYTKKNLDHVLECIRLCKSNNKEMYFVSTLLASKSSESIYNRTKALSEEEVIKNGFTVVRLGTVLLDDVENAGTYGSIKKLVKKTKIYPRISPDIKIFQRTGAEEIKQLIDVIANNEAKVFTLTNKKNERLDQLLDLNDNYLVSITIHWKILFLFFKLLEFIGVKSLFRSDMLKSIWNERPINE